MTAADIHPAPATSRHLVAPPTRMGLVVHGDQWWKVGGAMDSSGVKLVRFDVPWHGHGGTIDGLAGYRDDGVAILGNIAYRYQTVAELDLLGAAGTHCSRAPEEIAACVPANVGSGDAWNSFIAEWTRDVTSLVQNNVEYVKYWSVWNEPDTPHFFNGEQWQYVVMAREMCRIVHSYGAFCVGPEYGIRNGSYQADIDAAYFLVDNVKVPSPTFAFDVVALHMYDWYDNVNAAVGYAKANHGPTPVWITETGSPDVSYRAPAADPEFQERDIVRKAQGVQNGGSNIDALIYFQLRGNYSGIIDDLGSEVPSNWQKRPAFYALRDVMRNSWSSPGPYSGLCSGPFGYGACQYQALAAHDFGKHWDCMMTAHVETIYGAPVAGAVIRGSVAGGVLGDKLTDADGDASFSAECSQWNYLTFVSTPAPYRRFGATTAGFEWSTGMQQSVDFTVR